MKVFSLDDILSLIEEDFERETSEAGRKAKEYITWNNFLRYFEKFCLENLIEKFAQQEFKGTNEIPEEQLEENEEDLVEIKPVYLLFLQDIFDAQKRVQNDFIYTTDFIISAKRDPQVKSIVREPARGASKESGIGKETIGQFLDRLAVEAPEKINFQLLTRFLTRRGRPRNYAISKKDTVKSQK